MDIPLAIHIDSHQVTSLDPSEQNLDLKSRSLRNTLQIVLGRLKRLRKDSSHTIHDVEHYKYMLEHLEQRWTDEEGTFVGNLSKIDAPLASQCSKLWHQCHGNTKTVLIAHMEEEALQMPAEMLAIHSNLSRLHQQLLDLLTKEHSTDEVQQLKAQVDEINQLRVQNNGIFFGDVESHPPGQFVCSELLDQNYELVKECARTAHDEPEEFHVVADALRGIRNDLRKMHAQHQRHYSHEDISHYRYLLGAIASSEAEYSSEWEHSTAQSILNECLSMLQDIDSTAEEMNDDIRKIYNELKKMKHEMTTAISTSHHRPGEDDLRKWEKKLHDIDDHRSRHHGMFLGLDKKEEAGGDDNVYVRGNIGAPAGQHVCSLLMKQCYELFSLLRQR